MAKIALLSPIIYKTGTNMRRHCMERCDDERYGQTRCKPHYTGLSV